MKPLIISNCNKQAEEKWMLNQFDIEYGYCVSESAGPAAPADGVTEGRFSHGLLHAFRVEEGAVFGRYQVEIGIFFGLEVSFCMKFFSVEMLADGEN